MEKKSENKSKKSQIIWDVAVIGGGPSGMMSAGKSAECGAKTILLEKNDSLGKKLRITGGGRCNLTNYELDTRKFLEKFREASKFLFSTFSQFSVKDTLDFFNSRGMPTKVEAENRVFPESNSAESVWQTLLQYLKNGGVEILSNAEVKNILKKENKIEKIILRDGKEIFAKNFILATGGKSHSETGSTGDGFIWLKELGHKIEESSASLVPICIKDSWVKKLQGVTLKDVKISIFQDDKKQISSKGKILFTHFGISGPTILNLSKDIGESLKYGKVNIVLDLLPSLDHGALNTKLQEIFKKESNKKIKNSLDSLITSSLVPTILEHAEIDPDKACNKVTREERIKLIATLKNMKMEVSKLLGADKAIVTSGGVDLTEVDFKTMRSKIFSNLFFVGDILNINRPSGGYSLQLCWTTGFVAGASAAKN